MNDNCEQLRQLLPAYSLGATDEDESRLVERLLPECPEVAAELKQYAAVSRRLLTDAPERPLPAHLHDRVMQAIHQPTTTKVKRPVNGILYAAAAAVVLLVITNLFWFSQVTKLRDEQQLLTLALENDRRVRLMSAEQVVATVFWSSDSSTVLIQSDDLPELAQNRVYQLWLIEGEKVVSGGTLPAQEDAPFALTLPESLTGYTALAISEEPAGGSPQPTTSPLAIGTIEQVDVQ